MLSSFHIIILRIFFDTYTLFFLLSIERFHHGPTYKRKERQIEHGALAENNKIQVLKVAKVFTVKNLFRVGEIPFLGFPLVYELQMYLWNGLCSQHHPETLLQWKHLMKNILLQTKVSMLHGIHKFFCFKKLNFGRPSCIKHYDCASFYYACIREKKHLKRGEKLRDKIFLNIRSQYQCLSG